MGLVLLEALAEPVATLEEAQTQTRSRSAQEEDLLEDLVAAATAHAETYCRRRFVEQSWRLTLDQWPVPAVVVPHPPLISVESVKYVDEAGEVQTLDDELYVVRTDETPGEIVRAYDATWPAHRSEPGAVRVEFTCGYGAAASVPVAIKRAVLIIAAHMYAYRESVEIPPAATALLGPYRVVRY